MDVIDPPRAELLQCKFGQEEDTASPRDGPQYQELTVEINDGNGRDQRYYAITTERWAFNDISELVGLLKRAGVE